LILCGVLLFLSCEQQEQWDFNLKKKFNLSEAAGMSFYEPGGVAIDAAGNIYVADSGNCRVVKFSCAGNYIRSIGSKGAGPGEFLSPWKAAVFSEKLYIYDWRRSVQRFDLEGNYLDGFTLDGGLYLDMVLDSSGNIILGRWSSNPEEFLIHKFDSLGKLIQRFGHPLSKNRRPLNLIWNNFAFCLGPQDNLYVAFRYTNLIRQYDPQGELIREFSRNLSYKPVEPQHTPDEARPFIVDGVTGSVNCDPKGRLFITSNREFNECGHLVDVLDRAGKWLGNFYSGFLGEELASWAEVKREQTIFIDNKSNFYLLALGSMDLHVFQMEF